MRGASHDDDDDNDDDDDDADDNNDDDDDNDVQSICGNCHPDVITRYHRIDNARFDRDTTITTNFTRNCRYD